MSESLSHAPSINTTTTDPPPTTATANTTTTGANTSTKVLQKRWICDVCKVKWFLDFNEACEHEKNCHGPSPTLSRSSTIEDDEEEEDTENDSSEDENDDGDTNMISDRCTSNDSNDLDEQNDEGAPTDDKKDKPIYAPSLSKDGAAALAAARARVANKTSANDSNKSAASSVATGVSKKQRKISPTEILDMSELEMDNVDGAARDKQQSGRRKSKRVRDNSSTSTGSGGVASKPSALKDNNTSCDDTSNTTTKKLKKGKTTATKSDKSSSKKLDGKISSKKKKKGDSKGGGGQLASIFLPKKASSKTSTSVKGSNDDIFPGVSKAEYDEHVAVEKQAAQRNKKKRAVDKVDDGKAKKKQQLTLGNKKGGKQSGGTKKKAKQPEVMDIDSSSSDSDESDDSVEYVEKPKKKVTTKKKQQNKNFLSKKDGAEHQAADFFAKRKQKAAEERERQKKRDELRLMKLNNKAGGNKEVPDDIKSSALSGKSKTDKASSHIFSQEEVKGIPAVRFPCPTHIVSNDIDDDSAGKIETDSKSSQVLRDTMRYQHLKPDLSPSTSTDEVAYHLSGLYKDADGSPTTDGISTFDLLSTVFNQDSSSKKGDDDSDTEVDNSQLWVDKHSMTSIPDDVLGDSNKEQSKKLLDFVEEWKVRRHKSVQSLGQVKRKKKRRKKKKSGYDSDDSFLDDGGLENLFLITGPTGSGKTSLVHAVAEQSDCVVIEINSSEQRSGAALKRAIQETTQSHSSLAMSKKKTQSEKGGGFFGNEDTTNDLEDSDDYFDSDEESVRESHSLTIILIDEVDLLFDEDTAFWPALAQVAQKAKCPIVLTATSVPAELSNFRFKYITLERPLPQECSIKMAQVSKSEGMSFHDISLEEKLKRLSLIAEVCQCDMRKILNTMQLFAKSEPSNNTKVDMNNFGLQPNANCSSNMSNVVVEDDRPLVSTVEPKLVPRDKHTLITITGKGFSSTTFPAQPSDMFQPTVVFIGGKECTHFRVISDTQIIAVCPPCVIPRGVSKDIRYEEEGSKNIDCLTCKFAEIVVYKKSSNGLLLHSNSHLGAFGTKSNSWNVEYDIQLRDDDWEARASKDDLARKLNAQKKAQKNMADNNDGLMSSSDEEEFDAKPGPKKKEIESESEEDDKPLDDKKLGVASTEKMEDKHDSKESETEELIDVDPQTLLDEVIAKLDCKEPSREAMVPSDTNPMSLIDANNFADELARLSDAILIEDSLSSLAIPSLSGAVEGFGSHAIDPSYSTTDPTIDKLSKAKNKKPPSFETLYSSGVNETGFFFGCSDSYVTYPNMQRDRQLLSYSELHSRGLGLLDNNNVVPEEIPSEDSKSVLNDEAEEILPFFQSLQTTRVVSEDDLYLNPNVSATMSSLPSLLEQGLDVARKHGFTKDMSPLLHLRRSHLATTSLGIMHTTVANCKRWYIGLRHDDDDVAVKTRHIWLRDLVLDRPLSIDYLPYLRAIARHEYIARQQVEAMMKENGDVTRGGRRTRTSSRHIRRSYLCEMSEGKDQTVDSKMKALEQQLLE